MRGGGPIYTNNFGYDLADNRNTLSDGTSEAYTLNALNQVTQIYELGQPPHTTFTYDFNGNVTSKVSAAGTVSMQYDYENRLKKITYPDNGWTEFVYDGLGRLLKGVEKNHLGAILGGTHYVYDGLDMVAELNVSDVFVAGFTHGPGIDEPLMMRYDGADYFYLKNHQGSVTEVTSAAGSNVKTYKYDAFGNIEQETGPTINRGFTYTSRQLHARSGLYYYRARWYSPELGRFLTQDPIGHLGGVNLYAYVGNDPVNLIDPLGYCEFESPPDASVDVNIGLVDEFLDRGLQSSSLEGETRFAWFGAFGYWMGRVSPNGDWDYKRGGHLEYEAFGNFNYGATGTALGLPSNVLFLGGDLFAPRFRDSGNDKAAIQCGIDYYNTQRQTNR